MSAWVPRIIIFLAIAGIGGSIISISVGEGGPQSIDLDGRDEVQATIAGINQDAERLGDLQAEVTVDVFTDLRAKNAAEFQLAVVDPLIDEYVRPGRALMNLRHFSFGRSGVTEAAIAATVAGEQGYQWQYAEVLLRNLDQAGPQGIDEEFLNRIAEVTPGLEKEEWTPAFEEKLRLQTDDPDYEDEIDRDGELAFEQKLPAEPAILVTGLGGSEKLDATPSLADVRAAIERVSVPEG